MKNMYLAPITEQMDCVSNTIMEVTSTWNPGKPGGGMHPDAPQRLGSVGSIRNVGALGSTGHIK